MPAPLPSATLAPEKAMLSSVTSVSVTRIALPLGGATVATRFTMPPTPSMVILVLISAKASVYVPACTLITSPSCDAAMAACSVANCWPAPTVRSGGGGVVGTVGAGTVGAGTVGAGTVGGAGVVVWIGDTIALNGCAVLIAGSLASIVVPDTVTSPVAIWPGVSPNTWLFWKVIACEVLLPTARDEADFSSFRMVLLAITTLVPGLRLPSSP